MREGEKSKNKTTHTCTHTVYINTFIHIFIHSGHWITGIHAGLILVIINFTCIGHFICWKCSMNNEIEKLKKQIKKINKHMNEIVKMCT